MFPAVPSPRTRGRFSSETATPQVGGAAPEIGESPSPGGVSGTGWTRPVAKTEPGGHFERLGGDDTCVSFNLGDERGQGRGQSLHGEVGSAHVVHNTAVTAARPAGPRRGGDHVVTRVVSNPCAVHPNSCQRIPKST